jgi:GNAT superfamily N-acetyltransferase
MKYIGFVPFVDGDLKIGAERMTDILDEIAPLHQEHYIETEENYLDESLNADYKRYAELEDNAQFVLFTVRLGWKLVGYLQYYVFRDLHSQGMYQAREDALFLTKQARGQKIAPKLLSYAESQLPQLGVRYVGMTSKHPVGGPELGPFLQGRGYRHIADFYMKDLES